MKDLEFKAKMENSMTLGNGVTVVKLKSEDAEVQATVSMTFSKQVLFEAGEYEISIKKVVEDVEATQVL